MDSLDVNHVALLMKGYGHVLPSGYDEELGFDRYQLVHTFFDSYLKVEDKIPPVVLMISPVHQKENVTVLEPISVHFAPSIDKKSIARGIEIIRTDDNRIIEGEWKESRKSTKFVFSPKKQLKAGNYEIIVNSALKNQSGIHLEKKIISKFKITNSN